MGCGIGADLSFHDIIIHKNSRGAPEFTLSAIADQNHPYSNSDGGFAIAVVVIN
ncbi:Holo-[acyl-carrier protein] synthase [hydrothermal vent metagenome]|uniref:Holo-[acyl-carrier protein] synthase n=1 Tax=hydrothermal vent metagenome TaxID=652676 RepID=A0A1W1CM71_9ZZZZ